ncbi:MAG TPA: hypothetical protein VM163_05405 [bacterium]|nr:hypothetical protein [bacterium]
MAITYKTSVDRLTSALCDAIYKRIENEIRDKLIDRIEPLVEEAAREAAKEIAPAIINIREDMMTGDVHVVLMIGDKKEDIV